MDKLKNGLNQASGWMLYLSLLMLLALALPRTVFDPEARDFILLIGIVGIWRYSMGAMHPRAAACSFTWSTPGIAARLQNSARTPTPLMCSCWSPASASRR